MVLCLEYTWISTQKKTFFIVLVKNLLKSLNFLEACLKDFMNLEEKANKKFKNLSENLYCLRLRKHWNFSRYDFFSFFFFFFVFWAGWRNQVRTKKKKKKEKNIIHFVRRLLDTYMTLSLSPLSSADIITTNLLTNVHSTENLQLHFSQ